jgi:hypothetical protein
MKIVKPIATSMEEGTHLHSNMRTNLVDQTYYQFWLEACIFSYTTWYCFIFCAQVSKYVVALQQSSQNGCLTMKTT